MKIGIVGAGVAGLSAAYDFVNAGHEAVIYEAAPFMGGQASTIDVGGGRLERGYHHLFTNDHAILDLMDELGIGGDMQWLPSTVATYANDRIFPFVSALDLLRFKPLSFVDRIRMGLLTLRLQRINNWQSLQHLTAAEWIKKEASDGIYRNIWDPLLRAKFGKYHDRVGMPWLWSKFQTRVKSRKGILGKEMLGYPGSSFDRFFEKLSEHIKARNGQIHLSSPVERILTEDGRAAGLTYRGPDGETREERSDAVLATVPSFAFPKMIDLPDEYRRRVEGVHYMAAIVVILEMSHPLTKTYWMNITDDSIPFLGLIEHTNLMPKELYGGNNVLYLTNYLDREDDMYRMSQDDLVALYVKHLHRFNPDFDESWIKAVHYNALSAAQPIAEPGYAERIPSHETPVGNLYLANTTQIYPEDRGTNYSVRMGREVASLMMGKLA